VKGEWRIQYSSLGVGVEEKKEENEGEEQIDDPF
jgi:hypothetical protein